MVRKNDRSRRAHRDKYPADDNPCDNPCVVHYGAEKFAPQIVLLCCHARLRDSLSVIQHFSVRHGARYRRFRIARAQGTVHRYARIVGRLSVRSDDRVHSLRDEERPRQGKSRKMGLDIDCSVLLAIDSRMPDIDIRSVSCGQILLRGR